MNNVTQRYSLSVVVKFVYRITLELNQGAFRLKRFKSSDKHEK